VAYRKRQLLHLKEKHPRLTAEAPLCGIEPSSFQKGEVAVFPVPGDVELTWLSMDTLVVENEVLNA
jgi:hypothetical protein